MRTIAAFILAMVMVLAITPAPQVQAQLTEGEKTECETSPTLKQREVEMARSKFLSVQKIDPPTAAPYHLPLSVHIVRASNGTGGLTLNDMVAAINDLN